ncbi:MAG: hypothetical protein ABSA13_10490 [Beijerinckiaceae bacterium]
MGRLAETAKSTGAAAGEIKTASATLTMVHDGEYDQSGRRIEHSFRGYRAR